MKKKMLIILAMILLLTSGCTKYVTDGDKKRIANEETGQALTSNILCLPEKTTKDGKENKLYNTYVEYEKYLDVKLKDLPKCSDMKVYSKKAYKGLWDGLFVRPLGVAIIQLGKLVGNYGLSVIIIGLIIRIVLLPLSIQAAKQSKNMQAAQKDMERIEKKYANRTDKDAVMQKSQETMAIYQKYGINPMSSCLTSFIQLPIFFAFLEAINRVPAIFDNDFLVFQLGTNPLVGIQHGNYWYILLIVLIVGSTAFSLLGNMGSMSGSSTQMNQSKYMMILMIVFIGIASIQLPCAIALYWIATNLFSAVQTVIVKRSSKNER